MTLAIEKLKSRSLSQKLAEIRKKQLESQVMQENFEKHLVSDALHEMYKFDLHNRILHTGIVSAALGKEKRRAVIEKTRFCLHMSIGKATQIYGKEMVDDAVTKEIKQMVDKEVWHYVNKGYGKKILRSSMFITEKFDMEGLLIKLKARLVADGSTQNRELYDTASPTVKDTSIKVVIKIAAQEGRLLRCTDITGAYLNGRMPSHLKEIVRLDKRVVEIVAN